MCVRIGKPPRVDISALRENYISPELSEDKVEADPFTQVFLHLKQSALLLRNYLLHNVIPVDNGKAYVELRVLL